MRRVVFPSKEIKTSRVNITIQALNTRFFFQRREDLTLILALNQTAPRTNIPFEAVSLYPLESLLHYSF